MKFMRLKVQWRAMFSKGRCYHPWDVFNPLLISLFFALLDIF